MLDWGDERIGIRLHELESKAPGELTAPSDVEASYSAAYQPLRDLRQKLRNSLSFLVSRQAAPEVDALLVAAPRASAPAASSTAAPLNKAASLSESSGVFGDLFSSSPFDEPAGGAGSSSSLSLTEAERGFDPSCLRPCSGRTFPPLKDNNQKCIFPYGPSTAFSAVAVPGKAGNSATWKVRVTGNSSWSIGLVSENSPAFQSACFLYRNDSSCGGLEAKYGLNSRGTSSGILPRADMHDKDLLISVNYTTAKAVFKFADARGTEAEYTIPLSEFPMRLAICGFNTTEAVMRLQ